MKLFIYINASRIEASFPASRIDVVIRGETNSHQVTEIGSVNRQRKRISNGVVG